MARKHKVARAKHRLKWGWANQLRKAIIAGMSVGGGGFGVSYATGGGTLRDALIALCMGGAPAFVIVLLGGDPPAPEDLQESAGDDSFQGEEPAP